MQKNAEFYDFTQNLQGIIFQAGMKHYAETVPEDQQTAAPDYPPIMQIRRGYAESVAWMMVQLYEFHPEPLTVEKFRVRAVYSAPRLSQALLELIASEGWAHRNGEEYALGKVGYDVAHNLLTSRHVKFENFYPLAEEHLQTVVEYSNQIFRHALEHGTEQSTWCLRYSQKRKPTDASPIARLIHVCSDFNAWRDDSHMSAYTEQDVDGMTWEAFSYMDNEQAQTTEALFDKLAYRGWTFIEWQTALDHLCERSWAVKTGDTYSSTDKGKSVRQTVESNTDSLFYSAWSGLSEKEQVEYIHLLKELNEACMKRLSE